MKKIQIYTLIFPLILLLACDKDDLYLIPKKDVPQWLQDKIELDEDMIANDASILQNYGAWKQYTFLDKPFYQYINPLSSLCCVIYDEDGETYATMDPPYQSFEQNKCCEKLVWKGDRYAD